MLKVTQLRLVLIYLTSSFSAAVTAQLASENQGNDQEDDEPLWEAGVFAAGFNVPEYPSADQRSSNVIAAPYLVYRGEVFRIGDGSAARAVAFDEDWIELDLSLDAAFNADSEDNPVRQGMPDLDYLFEVGPQIKLRLANFKFTGSEKAKLSLDIKTRSVFSTDLSNFAHRGYVFHPEISYEHHDLLGDDSRLSIRFTPLWGSEKLHDYFYQVDNEFSTVDRPEYDAKGGYLGSELSVSLSTMVTDEVRVFVFSQMNLHQGAANQESPLFRDKNTYSVGIGFSWKVYESEELSPYQQF